MCGSPMRRTGPDPGRNATRRGAMLAVLASLRPAQLTRSRSSGLPFRDPGRGRVGLTLLETGHADTIAASG